MTGRAILNLHCKRKNNLNSSNVKCSISNLGTAWSSRIKGGVVFCVVFNRLISHFLHKSVGKKSVSSDARGS